MDTKQSLVNFDAPAPLEALVLSNEFNGSSGANRRKGELCHIQASNDCEAIDCWLAEFEDSPQTFRNYRKEVERLRSGTPETQSDVGSQVSLTNECCGVHHHFFERSP